MQNRLCLISAPVLRRVIVFSVLCLGGFALSAKPLFAQDAGAKGVAQYREMLEEGNPAELFVDRGAELWKEKRGPKQASLEKCDLGLGAGKIKGAYAQLPRYFKDTGKVMDLEGRLVYCMKTLQGIDEATATQKWYANDKPSVLTYLVAYIGAHSNGVKINVPMKDPAMKRMYAVGEYIFYRRAGDQDFSCAICHANESARIRLQDLANLTTKQGAATAMYTWPSYRNSQGTVWTIERRLIDCMRQQRVPEPAYLSDAVVALQVYLQANASGAVMKTPGIKR